MIIYFKMASNNKKQELAITVKKDEDFSQWYTQVILKADLIDYTRVSGCIVFKPNSYQIWEKVRDFFDERIKKSGVRNVYFPMFIPESLLKKEEKHIEGFTPEVAWVTHAGESELSEKLAIRPTSETIMYDSFSKWVKSYRDLPLRINQWCNVVRWEFEHPTPFLRNREFLWQEGHSVFASKEEAEKEVREILNYDVEVFEDLLGVCVKQGRKSEREKFAGADYTTSIETFLPIGKAIQCGTSHFLGQNFSRAFDIKFEDEKQKEMFAFQTSWGFSTRSLGIMIIMHSDDRGLVLPPKVAESKIVIVPLLFKGKEEKVLKKAREIEKSLSEFGVILDDRNECSPGFKFSEWEMRGVPLRIEIGPRDLEKNQVVCVKRNSGEKIFVGIGELGKRVGKILDEIQNELYEKSKKFVEDRIVVCDDLKSFEKSLSDKKWPLVRWCGCEECEEKLKQKYGAKSNNIPFEQPKKAKGKCVFCDDAAKFYAFIGKSL